MEAQAKNGPAKRGRAEEHGQGGQRHLGGHGPNSRDISGGGIDNEDAPCGDVAATGDLDAAEETLRRLAVPWCAAGIGACGNRFGRNVGRGSRFRRPADPPFGIEDMDG
jgi:hypothetical protein